LKVILLALREWFGWNGRRRVRIEPTISSAKKPDQPNLDFDRMPIGDILSWIATLPDKVTFQAIKGGLLRLYDIAYFDHAVEERHRVDAAKLIEVLVKTSEDGYVNAPDELAALKRATEFTESNIIKFGINSLPWLMEEYSIPAADTIPFIMKPEYGARLAAFF
jgi:hypothetical protein